MKRQAGDQDGHTPCWPRFLERKFIERILAYYDASRHAIVDEHEQVYELSDDFDAFLAVLWQYNLLLFVDSLVGFCFIGDMVASQKHAVFCNKKGEPIAARLKGPRNTTRWIVRSDQWGRDAGPTLLHIQRAAYDHCGVGTPTTPGGLGQALMRRAYRDQWGDNWREHQHHRPTLACCKDLLEHMTGGRVDTPGLGQTYDLLVELDQKNAYAAHYMRHPCGTAIRIWGRGAEKYATYFCHCTVTIPQDVRLALGPFPVRSQEGDHSVPTYPTRPGQYDAWLWREEVEDCQWFGLSVELREGWAWDAWTEDNAGWVRLVELLRDTAATPEIEVIVKGAIVAGIGRHGMADELRHLVGPEQAGPLDEQVSESVGAQAGLIYNWFVHATRDIQYNAQVHWFAYTIMQCRRTLFRKAYPYAEREQLAASNYDAVYVESDQEDIPAKGTPEARALKSGMWRKHLLHEVSIPAPRHLVSREKTRRPGVKRKKPP